MSERLKPESLFNKPVMTNNGKKLGVIKDLVFETNSGEIVYFVLTNPTQYALTLNLEQTKEKDLLVPWHSITAFGDFIVVDEKDLI
jgi:sporulation protein YlmC with PRC-barrel domain